MDDYFDEDVSTASADELGNLIKLRIRRYPSVQVFKDGRKTVLRTWRIDFDVPDAEGTEL
jgi:hypothetical protein